MTYNDYLAHYGILGMKWGKKNGPPYPLTSSQMSSSERKQNTPKAEDLSDEELNKKINRLRKEKEYEQLTAPEPSKAKKWVKSVLIGIGGAATGAFVGFIGKKIGLGAGKAIVSGAVAGEAFVKSVMELMKDQPSIAPDYYRYWPTSDEMDELKKK